MYLYIKKGICIDEVDGLATMRIKNSRSKSPQKDSQLCISAGSGIA